MHVRNVFRPLHARESGLRANGRFLREYFINVLLDFINLRRLFSSHTSDTIEIFHVLINIISHCNISSLVASGVFPFGSGFVKSVIFVTKAASSGLGVNLLLSSALLEHWREKTTAPMIAAIRVFEFRHEKGLLQKASSLESTFRVVGGSAFTGSVPWSASSKRNHCLNLQLLSGQLAAISVQPSRYYSPTTTNHYQ